MVLRIAPSRVTQTLIMSPSIATLVGTSSPTVTEIKCYEAVNTVAVV